MIDQFLSDPFDRSNKRRWAFDFSNGFLSIFGTYIWRAGVCYHQDDASFSDALVAVRSHLWASFTSSASLTDAELCLIPRLILETLQQVAYYSSPNRNKVQQPGDTRHIHAKISQILAQQVDPTPEKQRQILQLLHVKVLMSKDACEPDIKGWFRPGLLSNTR